MKGISVLWAVSHAHVVCVTLILFFCLFDN